MDKNPARCERVDFMNGKGDRPRPVDPEKWEKFFEKDRCRFHHMHSEECPGWCKEHQTVDNCEAK
jgi:hypothetical protein